MKGLLNKGKNLALSVAVKQVVNIKIAKFGEVSHLEFDTHAKTIDIEVQLKGEAELLKVFVDQYDVTEENAQHYLVVKQIRSSKEWLSSVLEAYVNNEKFAVPNEYAKILKVVI